jgi:O-methyltransferase
LRIEVRRIPAVQDIRVVQDIPDGSFYTPVFSPWSGYGDFARLLRLAEPHTLVSRDRLYVLYAFALNALRLPGEFWECGVYRGGTALLLAELIEMQRASVGTTLRLFDTFEGMPETDKRVDLHNQGDFADTSLKAVHKLIGQRGHVVFHPGWIPETFGGMEDSIIALAHIDVDIYRSVRDSCEFIYPRLANGAVLLFDDYGFPTCPGARKAVDEFFCEKPEVPIVLPTGQAAVIKLPRNN